jgi:hypothetical protein
LQEENYLAPVDFDAKDEADAKYVSYSASRLQERIEGAGARLTILVLDACRNNPFRTSRSGAGGLSAMNAGKGTLIAFATSPGKTADDNPGGANGLFTMHLVKAMREPGLSLDQVFNRVRERVYTDSGQRQLPWTVSSVIGEFHFRPGAGGAPPAGTVKESGILRAVEQAVGGTSPPAIPPRPQASPSEAEAAFTRGDLEDAVQKSQQVLRADPSNREALLVLSAAYYRQQQYDQFEGAATQAIQAGVEIPFLLGHHHTLTGIHASTLRIGAAGIAFDPMGASGCNQKAARFPLSAIAGARPAQSDRREIFLNLRIREAQNRIRQFNFADPDSRVDTSQGLPLVLPTEKSARMMQALANVLNRLATAGR